MTGFDNWTFETPEQAAARARGEFEAAEGDRRMVAELLAARGQREAAAIVALSSMDSDRVDDWDGGQYEVRLSVPVTLFDRVVGEMREQISAAAEAVIGAGHYRNLEVGIRRPDYREEWDRDFLQSLAGIADAPAQAAVVLALPPVQS